MKKRSDPKYFQEKIVTSAYAYRGHEIWKNAALQKWVINGLPEGQFPTLKEAKAYVDRVLKYGVRFTKKKKQCSTIATANPASDSSHSPSLK
jgi:hypothetical protein